MARSLGIGGGAGGLAAMGVGEQQDALELQRQAADMEAKREEQNKAIRAANKQANSTLGSAAGTIAGFYAGAEIGGSAGGPYGAVIGGALGYLFGRAFAILAACCLGMIMIPQQTEAFMVTQMELHQRFSYDPYIGEFKYLARTGPNTEADKAAGFIDGQGYVRIKIHGKAYVGHRLAWLYMLGEWPAEQIDHINGVRHDNRLENLRLVNPKEQSENRKTRAGAASGFRGVSWSGGKWHASIMHFGKQVSLGAYENVDEAKKARIEAEQKLFTHSNRDRADA